MEFKNRVAVCEVELLAQALQAPWGAQSEHLKGDRGLAEFAGIAGSRQPRSATFRAKVHASWLLARSTSGFGGAA